MNITKLLMCGLTLTQGLAGSTLYLARDLDGRSLLYVVLTTGV